MTRDNYFPDYRENCRGTGRIASTTTLCLPIRMIVKASAPNYPSLISIVWRWERRTKPLPKMGQRLRSIAGVAVLTELTDLADRVFQGDRAGKIDVVLEMDVLMEVLLEFP